jgi:hypothetical protein
MSPRVAPKGRSPPLPLPIRERSAPAKRGPLSPRQPPRPVGRSAPRVVVHSTSPRVPLPQRSFGGAPPKQPFGPEGAKRLLPPSCFWGAQSFGGVCLGKQPCDLWSQACFGPGRMGPFRGPKPPQNGARAPGEAGRCCLFTTETSLLRPRWNKGPVLPGPKQCPREAGAPLPVCCPLGTSPRPRVGPPFGGQRKGQIPAKRGATGISGKLREPRGGQFLGEAPQSRLEPKGLKLLINFENGGAGPPTKTHRNREPPIAHRTVGTLPPSGATLWGVCQGKPPKTLPPSGATLWGVCQGKPPKTLPPCSKGAAEQPARGLAPEGRGPSGAKTSAR